MAFFLHYGSPRTVGRGLGIMFFLIGQLVTIHQYGTVELGYIEITEILNEHTPTPTACGECLMIRSPLSPSPQTQTYQSETLIWIDTLHPNAMRYDSGILPCLTKVEPQWSPSVKYQGCFKGSTHAQICQDKDPTSQSHKEIAAISALFTSAWCDCQEFSGVPILGSWRRNFSLGHV